MTESTDLPKASFWETIWKLGVQSRRRITRSKRLPYPVLSVGNIASGGRAKTPLVIHLCQELKKANKIPVVLTRGYKRQTQKAVFLLPDQNTILPKVETTGDEALEIYLLTQCSVVVGASRYKNALEFLKVSKPNPAYVFVLDDGFQHWNLQRDLDIVSVKPEDRHARLLPLGMLREDWNSLNRAHSVLKLGVDFFKESAFVTAEAQSLAQSSTSDLCVVTTRVPDHSYLEPLETLLSRKLSVLTLPDHASAAILSEKLSSLKGDLLLGGKEAVKIFSHSTLRTFFRQGWVEDLRNSNENPTKRRVFFVECRLRWATGIRETLWKKVNEVITAFSIS